MPVCEQSIDVTSHFLWYLWKKSLLNPIPTLHIQTNNKIPVRPDQSCSVSRTPCREGKPSLPSPNKVTLTQKNPPKDFAQTSSFLPSNNRPLAATSFSFFSSTTTLSASLLVTSSKSNVFANGLLARIRWPYM